MPNPRDNFNVNRSSLPSYNQLQGVGQSGNGVVNALTHTGQVLYTQTFITGTNVQAGVSSTRSSTNSSFYFLIPTTLPT